MKRFLSFLALALLGPIWRMPAWAQLTTLGVGGIAAVVVGTLTTPAILPQPSTYFNMNGPSGSANYVLKTNNGTIGAEELPTTPANSHVMYIEGITPPYLGNNEYVLGRNAFNLGLNITNASSVGQPAFMFQSSNTANAGSWWSAIGQALASNTSATGVTNYTNGGYYPFTATGGGCARAPSAIFNGAGSANATTPITDPGFLCWGTTAPTASLVNVPGSGAATGDRRGIDRHHLRE